MNVMTDVPKTTHPIDAPHIDTYDVRDLVKDGVQACIMLGEQRYYLRITRAGKLILTK